MVIVFNMVDVKNTSLIYLAARIGVVRTPAKVE